MALYYVEDGSARVVVGSNAGGTAEPGWWRNLQARPEAEIRVRGERLAVRAREADGDERAQLWQRLVAANPDYAEYAARTSRRIPVVILEPRTTPSGAWRAAAPERAPSPNETAQPPRSLSMRLRG